MRCLQEEGVTPFLIPLLLRRTALTPKIRQTALEKRIKRHVIAREKTFFATTIPGFEELLHQELSSLSISPEKRITLQGGVEFKGRLPSCYLANLLLRTAHRILMRLGRFKASDFMTLRKKTEDLPWELFLSKGANPEIKVTARHSRLYHTNAVGECIEEGIRNRLASLTPLSERTTPPLVPVRIFIRALDDIFTLSLDSSGELLYRRGLKPHPAKAPLRETIAAAALLLAGYDGKKPLLDPMCGSGTFSLEAALMARNIPPGWFRDFAFMGWPAFRPRHWEFMRKEMEKNVCPLPEHPSILASDRDAASCEILAEALRHSGMNRTVSVSRRDFFDLSSSCVPGGPGLIAVNPPYGHRLGTRKESDRLFVEICGKLRKDFKGWGLALIVPGRHLLSKVSFPFRAFPIHHGGLRIYILTGTIS